MIDKEATVVADVICQLYWYFDPLRYQWTHAVAGEIPQEGHWHLHNQATRTQAITQLMPFINTLGCWHTPASLGPSVAIITEVFHFQERVAFASGAKPSDGSSPVVATNVFYPIANLRSDKQPVWRFTAIDKRNFLYTPITASSTNSGRHDNDTQPNWRYRWQLARCDTRHSRHIWYMQTEKQHGVGVAYICKTTDPLAPGTPSADVSWTEGFYHYSFITVKGALALTIKLRHPAGASTKFPLGFGWMAQPATITSEYLRLWGIVLSPPA